MHDRQFQKEAGDFSVQGIAIYPHIRYNMLDRAKEDGL